MSDSPITAIGTNPAQWFKGGPTVQMTPFAQRWLFSDPTESDRRSLVSTLAVTAGLSIALIVALNTVDLLHHRAPTLWMGIAGGLALLMSRVRYARKERPAVRLWQSTGMISALYALLHYPLLPVLPGDMFASLVYGTVIAFWLMSVLCGVACIRVPSLALVPAAYISWSTAIAAQVTGLPRGHPLDIAPLPEVSFCLALGFLILRLHGWFTSRFSRIFPANSASEFARIFVFFAIGIHLANYFWSAIAKLSLDGPPLAWVTFNNPLYLYLAALDNGYIVFSEFDSLVRTLATLIDQTHFASNALILSIQFFAIVGFLVPKRWLISLLLAFDVMHVSIWVIAGANFWPWILLNVAVVYVVSIREYQQPKLLIGLLGAAFIVIAPKVANVAWLGWFDSGANNKAFFEAEDDAGQRYYVPPNFFGFYSYPMAHMLYGMPEPDTAFATYHPNGSAFDLSVANAGVICNSADLFRPEAQHALAPAFSRFVVNYHELARSITSRYGGFPYNLYAHHFYVNPTRSAGFKNLPMDEIVAYVYKRESVCLSLLDGAPQRKVISRGEIRIDIPR